MLAKVSLEEAKALIEKKKPKKKTKENLRLKAYQYGVDFLVPVEERVLAHCELLPPQSLGRNIKAYREKRVCLSWPMHHCPFGS